MASLRETIDGLRAAGDVQGRLKSEIVTLHDQLAAARDAQVGAAPITLYTIRMAAMHLIRSPT